VPQYSVDLASAVMCHKALIYIWEKMADLKTAYPDLNKAMTLATEGMVRDIAVKCEDAEDGTCQVKTEQIGGIPEILAHLEVAIEWLTLEVDLESITEEPDADIPDTEGL
jgi:hypothetical protein